MLRFLPSMISLQAFESAARHLSFSKAAEELSLTQSAVSQQMRSLETLLRVKLFHRTRQRLSLTEAGLAYLPDVRQCLSRMEAATLQLMSHQGTGGVLNLAILPTFGTRWLIPRMSSFGQAHPHVTVNFSTRAVKFDFSTERLDAAIHFGDVAWPGVIAHRLMGENVVLVCAPSLLKRLRSPKDLTQHTLLQHATRPHAWQEWLAAVGVQDVNPMKGPRFEHFAMVIQAAVARLGVAILPEFLVQRELAAGELVQPFEHPVRSAHAYYLVYPEENRDLPALKAFREWLLNQVAAARCLLQDGERPLCSLRTSAPELIDGTARDLSTARLQSAGDEDQEDRNNLHRSLTDESHIDTGYRCSQPVDDSSRGDCTSHRGA